MRHELPDYDFNPDDDPADDPGQPYYVSFPGDVYVRFPPVPGNAICESRLSRDERIAGGVIDVILGRGMVALEEAIAGETRINTGDLWASLKGMPALAATFDRGIEAVFGAAGLIASEREVMRGYCLEALPAAEVADFTGRTVYATEALIKRASQALRLLSAKVTTKSPTGGEM